MGLRCIRTGAAALCVAVACAAPAAALETGVNETAGYTLPLARSAAGVGADWVRIWGTWESVQPSPGAYAARWIDHFNTQVAQAHARNVKVLMVVHRSPAWASGGAGGITPPADPARFGAFMRGLAQRLPGVDAWEIWNEEDAPEFWRGAPEPASYAALLRAAYPAIKAVQPGDTVVTGGTVGNNIEFVEALYAHGAQGSFDAVGVHTDTACLTVGPDFAYRDEHGRIGQYAFTGYREVHDVMARHGDGAKPTWMTELGWNSQSTAPHSCSVGGRKGTKPLGVSAHRQATYLTAAYRCLAADPYVQAAFWFGLQDIRRSAGAGGYGLYRLNGSPKPSARAFRALDKGIAPRRRCGGVVDHVAPVLHVSHPVEGQRFAGKLTVQVAAIENPGGAGYSRMELFADGRRIRTWHEARGHIRPWWATAHWRLGRHTLTFKAHDHARNVSSATVHVLKVRRGP